jgi:hypothetical protein
MTYSDTGRPNLSDPQSIMRCVYAGFEALRVNFAMGSLDHSSCFPLPLRSNYVTPLPEFRGRRIYDKTQRRMQQNG